MSSPRKECIHGACTRVPTRGPYCQPHHEYLKAIGEVGYFPKDVVTAHVDVLIAAGMYLQDIAEAARVHRSTVQEVRCARTGTIRADCARRILAVAPVVKPSRNSGDGRAVVRRVRALQCRAFTVPDIAGHAGLKPRSLAVAVDRGSASIATERAVRRVYPELCTQWGTSKRTATIAKKNGFVPPAGWDDIDNDPEPAVALEPVIDEVAIRRVFAGGDHRILRVDEKRELFRIATEEKGWPPYRAAELLHWSPGTLRNAQKAIGQVAA